MFQFKFIRLQVAVYKLLLVEDDFTIALLLKHTLEGQGYSVTHTDSVLEAFEQAKSEEFHLAILDVQLPDGNGFDLCRQIRDAGNRMPILILTGLNQSADLITGFDVGADDYLPKPFKHDVLLARINALIRRSYGALSDHDQTIIKLGSLTVNLATQRVTKANKLLYLTAIEFKLLAFFIQRPNVPCSRAQLLEKVWGYDKITGDARTVDVHIRNLRQKIETDPHNPTIIKTVRGSGYQLVDPLSLNPQT